jgi:Flp pilus assembly protein TadG
MMMNILRSLISCNKGAAAAEMVFVTPLLVAIMFGIFEAGNFFWSQHVVSNAVRDGARFAGRRPLSDYADSTCVPVTSVITDTRNVTRTGRVTGGTPRIPGWTAATTVAVTAVCSSGTTGGIYRNEVGGAPVVTVTATVPYNSLFGILGFNTTGLSLQADAQASVMGF